MNVVCAGLALWFALIVITPTLDVTIEWAPSTTTTQEQP